MPGNPYPPNTYPAKLYNDIHGPDVPPAPPAPGGKPQLDVPSGAIDGGNKIFTLAAVPTPINFQLFWNGVLQFSPDDFVLSGNQITMTLAPNTGDKLVAYY